MAKNSSVNLDITNNAVGVTIGGGSTKRSLSWNGNADITFTQSSAVDTDISFNSPLSADVVVTAGNYSAAGTLLYGTAGSAAGTSAPATLAAGTSGQVLQSSGSSIAWASLSLLSWSAMTSAETGVPNSGYYVTSGNQALTLPAAAPKGTYLAVYAAQGSSGWTIVQGAGQSIQFGSTPTTTGAGGSLASSAVGDGVMMLCTEDDAKWLVISSVGNITIV